MGFAGAYIPKDVRVKFHESGGRKLVMRIVNPIFASVISVFFCGG